MASYAAVWKTTQGIADVIELELPEGSELLKVDNPDGGGGTLTFWFLVRDLAGLNGQVATERPKETRRFLVLGTGHTIAEDRLDAAAYRDTVIGAGGLLVWHVFEEARS